MELNVTFEQILNTLKDWGWNHGEFEELVVRLAKGNGFDYLSASINEPWVIDFNYHLNDTGHKIAWAFAFEYGLIPIEDFGFFCDFSSESVANTLKEWGIRYPFE